MKKITLIAALLTVAYAVIFAQTEQQKSNLNIDGQIAISTNAKALFVNLGGPTIRFNFQKFSIGGTFYLPGLKFENKASKLLVTPCLGVGPRLFFLKDKRYIVEFPCYYTTANNAWTVSAGVGYALTKPNKQ
jgi:opacity protein-like surface antigen